MLLFSHNSIGESSGRDWVSLVFQLRPYFSSEFMIQSTAKSTPPSTWTSNRANLFIRCLTPHPTYLARLYYSQSHPTIHSNRHGNHSNVKFRLRVFALLSWRAAAAAAADGVRDASSTIFRVKTILLAVSRSIRCNPVSTFTRTEIIRQSCCAPLLTLKQISTVTTKYIQMPVFTEV